MERHILAIDVGTSSLKASLLTEAGRKLSFVRSPLLRPGEHLDDWDPDRWIRAMRESVHTSVGGRRLAGIAISGNGPTVVGVDGSGRPVSPSLLWYDGRQNGRADDSSFYLPKIAWLREHRPEVFARVRTFFAFPEYLLYYLTGQTVTISPSNDFSRYIWNGDSVARYDLDPSLFPPYVGVGTHVGNVRQDVADRLGIASNVPVYAGGADFLMSLLGTATVRSGLTCDRAGTSEGINHCCDRSVSAPALRVLPHVIPGFYNVAGILSSTGLLFEWFREISGQNGRDYTEMVMDIHKVARLDSSPWFFPSVHKGAAWEFKSGMFIGLGAEHDRTVMGRAVVHSIGFAVRESVEILEQAGCTVTELRSCGGQAKNSVWTQMKANMVGRPIVVPDVVDAELTGNLCAAMRGIEGGGLDEWAEKLVRFPQRFEPDREAYERYSEMYDHYRDRYDRFRQALSECV